MLKQAKSQPDFDEYLCYLLSDRNAASRLQSTPETLHVARAAAAIMLKNNIKTRYSSIPESSKAYVKSRILEGLEDPNAQMRNHCGNVITEVVKQGKVLGWRELLPTLVSMISNESGRMSPEAQEGAMGALLKICEDNKKALTTAHEQQQPSDYLVPSLIQITSSPLPKVRARAVQALNFLLEARADVVVKNLDDFLRRLFDLAQDDSQEVKKEVCRTIVRFAEFSPQKIIPHLQPLVTYLLEQQQNDGDPDLALEAAEFWLSAGEDEVLQEHLGPYLTEIIPVLLQCMIYSQDDVLRLDDEAKADDAEAQDRQQDIKPTFAARKANAQEDGESSEEGEIDEDEYGFGGDDPEEQWNLRKCSAAALDVLATVFKQPVFDVTLPYLTENLSHKDWPHREAAVLAIGAVAQGCMDTMKPYLPQLIPYLISLLDDTAPVVRKITCWAIGRYSEWSVTSGDDIKQQFFVPMMEGLLKRMLDTNKRVQEAAASAFLTMEENSQAEMGRPEYLQVIVQQFNQCFAKYRERNMLILLDAVAQLGGIVGTYRSDLPDPDIVGNLMPALLERLKKIPDHSSEMFPLLECMTCMANALRTSFTPYAKPVYDRAIKVIFQSLEDSAAAATNEDLEEPDKDFLITSLDTVGGVVQALDPAQTRKLLSSSSPNLFDLLPLCLQDTNADVQQSAFALLGDTAIHLFEDLQPHLPIIMPILLSRLSRSASTKEAAKRGYPVMNNACWSCGEIAMRADGQISSFADGLLQNLFDILTHIDHATLRENAAIALGRISGSSPENVAPYIDHVSGPLLSTLQNIHSEEKISAVRGFSKAVLSNPQALASNFAGYLMVVCATGQVDPVVQQVRGAVAAPRLHLTHVTGHRCVQAT